MSPPPVREVRSAGAEGALCIVCIARRGWGWRSPCAELTQQLAVTGYRGGGTLGVSRNSELTATRTHELSDQIMEYISLRRRRVDLINTYSVKFFFFRMTVRSVPAARELCRVGARELVRGSFQSIDRSISGQGAVRRVARCGGAVRGGT